MPFWGWLFATLLVLSACSGLAGEPVIVATLARPTAVTLDLNTPPTPPDLALGAQIYAANCTRCHGLTGAGDGEMVASGQVTNVYSFLDPQAMQGKTLAGYYEVITNGRLDRLMPPWADALSADERWAVAQYVLTLAQRPVATPAPTAAPQVGSISGRVSNGTAGAVTPSGLTVNLLVTQDGQLLDQRETPLQADGRFTFADVTLQAGANYVTAVLYRERIFRSSFAQAAAGAGALDLPITIYELTEDPAVLHISRMVTQVSALGDMLEVQQVILINNSSDRAFSSSTSLGEGRYASVIWGLPPGAQAVSFSDPTRYTYVAEEFTAVDSQPVIPGQEHLMLVAYLVPYDGRAAIFDQPLAYAVDGLMRLLVTPKEMSIKSEQLPPLGTETLANGEFAAYGGTLQWAAGSSLKFEISGAGAQAAAGVSATSTANGSTLALLLALLGVGAVGAAVFLYWRGRAAKPLDNSLDALVQQIAALDDAHKAGRLNHDVWQRQRAELKAQLAQRMGEDQ